MKILLFVFVILAFATAYRNGDHTRHRSRARTTRYIPGPYEHNRNHKSYYNKPRNGRFSSAEYGKFLPNSHRSEPMMNENLYSEASRYGGKFPLPNYSSEDNSYFPEESSYSTTASDFLDLEQSGEASSYIADYALPEGSQKMIDYTAAGAAPVGLNSPFSSLLTQDPYETFSVMNPTIVMGSLGSMSSTDDLQPQPSGIPYRGMPSNNFYFRDDQGSMMVPTRQKRFYMFN